MARCRDRVIHAEGERLRARQVHEPEHRHQLDAVALGQRLLAQLAREPVPLQVPGEAELVGIRAHVRE